MNAKSARVSNLVVSAEAGNGVGVSMSRQEFLNSEGARILREQLEAMVEDPGYNTATRYSLVVTEGSQFVEKHMLYMANHPSMNHDQYLSNIKLMTKVRT